MSTRPTSGKGGRPSSGKLGGGVQLSGTGEVVSYEDILVAQYLEELRKSPPYTKPTSVSIHSSPYLQKLAHTHIVPTTNMAKRRPASAIMVTSSSKPKVDPKFIADSTLWDPATPREEVRKKRRPISAPVYKRPMSAVSSTYGGSTRPTSAKSSVYGGKRVKSLYRRQPHVIVVTAFKNGDREVFAKTAAPTIKMLLEQCTDKLGLPTAARRIFLDDGTEVFTPKEIPRDAEVFISCGEPFKDPFKPVKKQDVLARSTTWTRNGVVWNQDCKKRTTKPRLSKRFRNLLEQSRRRVLVFKNSHGSQGTEIVADPDRFEDFLMACTAKLDLGSYARALYDWEGNEIHNLQDAPVLDQCLQTWSTPVLGPLWVSKGEGFSPKGVCEFLDGLINYTKGKLKEAEHYKQQLQYGQNEETKDKVEIVTILSMSPKEIEEALDIVNKDTEDFGNALNRLKQQKAKIKQNVAEEAGEGFQYTLKHIEEIDANHRMVGTKGIRLKVYENGSDDNEVVIFFNLQQAIRGIGNDKEMLLSRLLDQCGSCSLLANPKINPAIRPIPKKIYDNMGRPITNVFDLEYDQEIWLSFGEPWKNPFTYVVGVTFDKVRAFDIQGANSIRTGVREQLMVEDTKGRERSNQWEVVEGIPDAMNVTDVHPQMDPAEREHIHSMLETSEIHPAKSHFLHAKDDPNLLLYGEVIVDTKKKKGCKDLWPADAQNWVISKNGYIYSKAFPQLVLGVSDQRVGTNLRHPHLGHSNIRVEGFAVSLQRKESSSAQQWEFTPEGFIQNAAHPGLYLTYLGAQFGNEESRVINEIEGAPPGVYFYLAVCDKQEGKALRSQRWALKQERFDNLGQWKHTKAENPEWNKRALSWPVNEDGSLNENYDWPMEGFLLPYAPPIKSKSDSQKQSGSGSGPIRLLVLKNGERDVGKIVPVVGPDLTNMRKDHEAQKKKSKKTTKDPDAESIDIDLSLHCDKDMSILQLELIMFLERCTTMLDLPFAARRLFDQTGKEHFSLRSLERDQVVYVTCGEPWSDPNLSKAEQQRRHLLANLNRDLDQIRQFVALRRANNLVLEVEGGLSPGSRLVVNESALAPQEEPSPLKARHAEAADVDVNDELFNGRETAHEIAHQRAEERLNRLKWPWERIENGGFENQEVDENEKNYSNKELYQRFKQRARKNNVDATLQAQKFVFEDGFIMCAKDRSLVLTISEQEGRVTEVTLARQKPDDIFQRWIMCENNIIQSKNNPNMVLTVGMPSGSPDSNDYLSYYGCPVTLQAKKPSQFGRANQRWHYDPSTGFIEAFHTDTIDKEITAANKANVCTFAVMGGTEIDQPGYVVEMQIGNKTDKDGAKISKKILVCSSCARSMRGRHKLERVKNTVDFACSMGEAKQLGIKQIGSFQCLNGKVDLSTFEAEHTLNEWEAQLEKLREELSVRTIAKEICAARTPYTVKVMAFKNGEGRLKPGEIIVGSSVAGILEQATTRLGLRAAARRLYTYDGMVVLDLDDLVEWVRQEYVKEARTQMKREAKAKRLAKMAEQQGGVSKSNLMDKVQLDSDFTEEEEDEDEEAGQERGSEVAVQEVEENFMVGYSAESARPVIDPASWRNVIMLPNPAEGIEADGFITQWQLFAIKEGKVALLTLRPNPEADLNTFELTGKIVCEVPHAGHHTLDLDDDIKVPVQRGDLIAFHSIGDPIIPYEIDKEANQNPFYKKVVGDAVPSMGDPLKMNMWNQNGTRKYAFCAQVTTRVQKWVEVPIAKQRPATATKKKGKKGTGKGPYIEPPSVDMVLRYPIEVWVSCGEAFVKPESVEKNYELSQEQREERAAVSYELDKEKHVLRHMQGRRIEGQNPGEYRGTKNPTHPVLVHGHWQDAPIDEIQKHDIVHQLETHLHELKASQKPHGVKPSNSKATSRLYTQPSMKRVLVFPNGDNLERAVYVWGETMEQLLDNSTTRLNLRKPAKYVFDLEGRLVDNFADIERDQLLCVGHNRTFLQPRESRQMVEIKANWGRARKQYGPQATELMVSSKRNPGVDVDPFGPSPLAGGQSTRSSVQDFDDNDAGVRRPRAKSALRR